MQKLLKIIDSCFRKNIPFVSFRYPNEKKIFTWVQISGKIIYVENAGEVINKSGFVYAPFHRKTNFPVVFFEPEIIIEDEDIENSLLKEIENSNLLYPNYEINKPEETDKQEYLTQAHKFIDSFDDNFQKAVLSRVKIIEKKDIDTGKLFLELKNEYPQAFCHLIHIPGAGTWAGATPETLIRTNPEIAKTASIAGTLPANEKTKWHSKESEEQQIVTDYIENLLKEFKIKSYKKEKTETIKAGNALHLSTGFQFPTSELRGNIAGFIEKLHPTPAVCGSPKEKALNLILETERHNREYYSGFLGTVNMKANTDLFVNLRCMKILPDRLALFVGGGLTKGSVPEKEWEETVLKTETLLALL